MQSLPKTKHGPRRPKYKGPFSIDCRERGFHARGVYPAQYTSHMETARMKQEEGADTRIIDKEEYEIWKEGTWVRRGKVT